MFVMNLTAIIVSPTHLEREGEWKALKSHAVCSFTTRCHEIQHTGALPAIIDH